MRDDDSGRVSVVGSRDRVDGEGPTTGDAGADRRSICAGLTGMDLVRRTLEEARGAARSQGKNVGRGRTSPTTATRRRSQAAQWSGPGPDVRDPQTLGSGDAGSGAHARMVRAGRRGHGAGPVADGGRRADRRTRDSRQRCAKEC